MPPLTIENASALCGGVQSKEQDMQAKQPGAQSATVDVEVLRAFQDHRRQILKTGDKATLPRLFAIEMQAANKVRIIEPKTETPPATTSVPKDEDKTPRKTSGKKGEKDAG